MIIHDFSKKSLATQPPGSMRTRPATQDVFVANALKLDPNKQKPQWNQASQVGNTNDQTGMTGTGQTIITIDPRPPRTWFVAWASSGGIKGYSGSAGSLLSSLSRQNMVQNVRYENCCKSLGFYCHMLRKSGRYRERERERDKTKRQTNRQTDR